MGEFDFSQFSRDELISMRDAMDRDVYDNVGRDTLIKWRDEHDRSKRPDTTVLGDLGTRFGIGVDRLQQAGNVIGRETGILSDSTAAEYLAENQREISEAQQRTDVGVDETIRKIADPEVPWSEIGSMALDDPLAMARGVTALSTESVPLMAPLLATGGVASLLTGGAAAPLIAGLVSGIGAGVGSAGTEYAVDMTESMSEAGVNTADASEVTAFLSNPEKMAEARSHAVKRGMGVGVWDAVSFGIASKLFGPLSRGVRSAVPGRAGTIAGGAVGGTAEMAGQMGAGGAGEFTAQALTGESDSGQIRAEMLGEFVPGIIESGVKGAFGSSAKAKISSGKEREKEELRRFEEADNATATAQQSRGAASLADIGQVDANLGQTIDPTLDPVAARALQDQQPDVTPPEDLSGALPEGQPPVAAPQVPETPVRPTEPAMPWSSVPERTRKKIRTSRRNRGVVEKADVAAPITKAEIEEIVGDEGAMMFDRYQRANRIKGVPAVIPGEGLTSASEKTVVDESEFGRAKSLINALGRVGVQELYGALTSKGGENVKARMDAMMRALVVRGVISSKSGEAELAAREGRSVALDQNDLVVSPGLNAELPPKTTRRYALAPRVQENGQGEGYSYVYSGSGGPVNTIFKTEEEAETAAKKSAEERGRGAQYRVFPATEKLAAVEQAVNKEGEVVGEAVREIYTPESTKARVPEGKTFDTIEGAREAAARVAPALGKSTEETVAAGQKKVKAYQDKAAPIFDGLTKLLKGMGLSKDVVLRLQNVVLTPDGGFAEGSQLSLPDGTQLIRIAIEASSLTGQALDKYLAGVLNHEVIHALRALGVFTETEWKTLTTAAAKRKSPKGGTFLQQAQIRYPELSPEGQQEESIAEMHREWAHNPSVVSGKPASLFRKMAKFIAKLGGWAKKNEFADAEDIMRAIQSGEVGGRERGSASVAGEESFSRSGSAPANAINALRKMPVMRHFRGPVVDEQLEIAANPGSLSTIVMMSPKNYLKMATYGHHSPERIPVYAQQADRGMQFDDLPYLNMEDSFDPSGTVNVEKHGGRHRAAALQLLKYKEIPVLIRMPGIQWGVDPVNMRPKRWTGQEPLHLKMKAPDSFFYPAKAAAKRSPDKAQRRVTFGLAPEDTQFVDKMRDMESRDMADKRKRFPELYARAQRGDYGPSTMFAEASDADLLKNYGMLALPSMLSSVAGFAKKTGARVYNTTALGAWKGMEPEVSSGMHIGFPADVSQSDFNETAARVMDFAAKQNQWGAFVSEDMGPDYRGADARPGITVYFYAGEGLSQDRLIKMVEDVRTPSISGFTAYTTGSRGGYQGMTFIWTPEYSGVLPENLVADYKQVVVDFEKINKYIVDNNYGSTTQTVYKSIVGRSDNYEQIANDLRSGFKSGGAGGSGPWGQSVSASISSHIAAAERAEREASRRAGRADDGGKPEEGPGVRDQIDPDVSRETVDDRLNNLAEPRPGEKFSILNLKRPTHKNFDEWFGPSSLTKGAMADIQGLLGGFNPNTEKMSSKEYMTPVVSWHWTNESKEAGGFKTFRGLNHFGTHQAAVDRQDFSGVPDSYGDLINQDLDEDGIIAIAEGLGIDENEAVEWWFKLAMEDKVLLLEDFHGPKIKGSRQIPVYLSIANPQFQRDATQQHTPEVFAHESSIAGSANNMGFNQEVLPRRYVELINTAEDYTKAMEDMGYDGVAYINDTEDRGSISWTPFHGEQVQSIWTNWADKKQVGHENFSRPAKPLNIDKVFGKDQIDPPAMSDKEFKKRYYQGDEPPVERFAIAGVNAKTADLMMLDTAVSMEEESSIEFGSPAAIYRKTGWFRGDDDMWRFNTSDKDMFLADELMDPNLRAMDLAMNRPADHMFGDDELFAAYPELRKVTIGVDLDQSRSGVSLGGKIGISPHLSTDDTMRVILHEMQHEIQNIEGFAKGGNTDMFKTKQKYTMPELINRLKFVKGLKSLGYRPRDVFSQGSNRDPKENRYLRSHWRMADNTIIEPKDIGMTRVEASDIGIEIVGEIESESDVASYMGLIRNASSDPRVRLTSYRRLAGEIEARVVEKLWEFESGRRSIAGVDGPISPRALSKALIDSKDPIKFNVGRNARGRLLFDPDNASGINLKKDQFDPDAPLKTSWQKDHEFGEKFSAPALAVPAQDTAAVEALVGKPYKHTLVDSLKESGADWTGRLFGSVPGETWSQALLRNSIHRFSKAFDIDRRVSQIEGGNDDITLGSHAMGAAFENATDLHGRTEYLMDWGSVGIDPVTGEVHPIEGTEGYYDIHREIGQKNMDYYQAYRIALREVQLRPEDRASFTDLTTEQLQSIIDNAPPEFARTHERFKAFNSHMLQLAVDSGTMKQEMADKFASMDHLPYYRLMEDDFQNHPGQIVGPRMANGINNPKSVLQDKLKGGNHPIGNLYDNDLRNMQSIMSASLRNHALQVAAKSIDTLVDAGFNDIGYRINNAAEVGNLSKHKMTFYEEGKKVEYVIDDPAFWVTISALRPHQRSEMMKIAMKFSALLRQGITVMPGFMAANLWRGKISAYVISGAPLSPMKTYTGLMDALKSGHDTAVLKLNTGIGGYTYGQDQGSYASAIASKQRLQDGGQTRAEQAIDRMSQFARWVNHVGEATEMAERNALYHHLVENGMPKGRAAYEAKNIINFNRRGAGEGLISGILVKGLVPMIPFLNARIQGLYRIFENQKGEKTVGYKNFALPASVLMRGTMLGIASTMLYALASGDDRWDDESIHTKINNDIIYTPFGRILLPKAFEVGSLFTTIPMLALDEIRGEEGDQFTEGMISMIMNTLAFNPIPQAVRPILEHATGRNFFTGTPLEGTLISSMMKGSRMDARTSELGKAVGNMTGDAALLEIFGMNLSPVEVDHLVTGYLGGLGQAMLGVTDAIVTGAGYGPERPGGLFGDGVVGAATEAVSELGGFRRFYREDYEAASANVGAFYDMKINASQIERTIKDAIELGDLERARDILKDNKAPVAMRKMFDKVGKYISKINRQIRNVDLNETMTPSQKRTALIPLKAMKKKLATQAVRMGRSQGL